MSYRILYVAGDGPQGCHHHPGCPATLLGGFYDHGTCTRRCRVRQADEADRRCRQPTVRDAPHQWEPEPQASRRKRKGKAEKELPPINHSVIALFVNVETGESFVMDIGS